MVAASTVSVEPQSPAEKSASKRTPSSKRRASRFTWGLPKRNKVKDDRLTEHHDDEMHANGNLCWDQVMPDTITCITFAPDATTVAAGSVDKRTILFNCANSEVVSTYFAPASVDAVGPTKAPQQ